MGHIVSIVVDFASNHAGWAYALAFVVAGFESFPVLGAVIPGTATIVALAALVPEGALSIWPLAAATTAGAIAGDGFSYWLGHAYARVGDYVSARASWSRVLLLNPDYPPALRQLRSLDADHP